MHRRNVMRRTAFSTLLFLTALQAVQALQAPQAPQARFDILIKNAHVYDGNGNPWILADVGITGDRITAVGTLTGAKGTKEIDARRMAVTPGFIDVHSHAGGGLATETLKHGGP